MKLSELRAEAERFLDEFYGLTLDVPIIINNRLRRALGRYQYTIFNEPVRIELAGITVKYGAPEVILDVLYHELIHYALHVKGLPHGDGDEEFESELRRHGVSTTESFYVGILYLFECSECGKRAKTSIKRAKERGSGYRSICCSSDLKYIGKEISDGLGVKEVAI